LATVVGSATPLMLAALREQARVQQGRNPQPSAGIIDSQSVKGADTAGRDSRGYDAGKKINGKQRFIVTDTLGLLSAYLEERPVPRGH
jgi:DDE family transposase